MQVGVGGGERDEDYNYNQGVETILHDICLLKSNKQIFWRKLTVVELAWFQQYFNYPLFLILLIARN